MGGQWGVGASLVLETVPHAWRGVLSGLLHQGYSLGNLLAALAFLVLYPAMQRFDPANAWRYMFFLGGLPALLSVFVLAKVKESEAWQEHRTDWGTYVRSMPAAWRRFLYLVLLLTAMGFISHGTQDLYPTFLQQQRHFTSSQVALTTMLSMVGAIIGGMRHRSRVGPVRTPTRDDRWRARARWSSSRCGCRTELRADCGRRIPDAVLRAGRVGRHPRAYERTVAGAPARLPARVRVPARHAVRRRRAAARGHARRALLVCDRRWAVSQPLPSSSAALSSASAPRRTASVSASSRLRNGAAPAKTHPGTLRRVADKCARPLRANRQ